MKDKKVLIIILGVILIVLSCAVYTRIIASQVQEDDKIVVDIEKKSDGLIEEDTEDDLMLTEQDATNLALEQIDISKFNVSILHGIKEIDQNKYYLFDIVNKSGPSFATKLAVNIRSGEMFGYDPSSEMLLPMAEFPIETPIAMEQDWNNRFVAEETGEEPLIVIALRQGDMNSFEFDILQQTEEPIILFQGVARISGAMASYEGENGFGLTFVKDGENLKVKEIGLSPFKKDGVIIEGAYIEE